MKAVIMAGGQGSRLRPLTCNKPKPMVPLLGRPCMEYTLELLQRTGISDVAVTLQYMPELIRGYFGDGADFGLNLHYFEENSPLGTAGSVKNAAAILDETFVVISGDALTDFRLTEAIQYHREKGALATIVLTRVETPLEYGVAITEADGRILRFLEKPSWGEVFSDTVNTGIYIFEKEILDFIPTGQMFDFSKDLFPLLMQNGHDLYGYVADGYWSDIGNLAQYRQTQFDMLDGLAQVNIRGQRVAPRVWLEAGVQLPEDATLVGPCYIGAETVLEAGVTVGPYTVVGKGNILKTGTTLKRTVLWDQNYVGEGAELRGSTMCSQVTLGAYVACFEGAVIGNGCALGNKSRVMPQVKLWPHKRVQEGATAHTSLVWGEKLERNLFGKKGVQGIGNVELTPDFAGRLAAAFSSTLPFGAQIALSSDSDRFAVLLKQAFAAGLQSGGVNTVDCGACLTPMLRYAVKTRKTQGGVHIRRVGSLDEDRLLIEFVDAKGLNIDKGLERKIENAFWQEDFHRANLYRIGSADSFPTLQEAYVTELLRTVDTSRIRQRKFHIVVQVQGDLPGRVLPVLLEPLGCKIEWLTAKESAQGELASLVAAGGYDFGVRLDNNGEQIALVTEQGQVIEEEVLLALQALVYLADGGERFAVPVTAPSNVEAIATKYDGEVVRTKANPRALMEPLSNETFQVFFDALYTLIKLLDTLALNGKSLQQLLELVPPCYVQKRAVSCPWEFKGRVMRLLMEETKGQTVELLDGIKVFTEKGWTLILPDSDQPLFQVYAQGISKQAAEQLVDHFSEKIREYQSAVVQPSGSKGSH